MNVKDQIKMYFFERAPNTILEEQLFIEFEELQPIELKEHLAGLVAEGCLVKKVAPQSDRNKEPRVSYVLSEAALANYPIKTQIEVAGIKVPRLLDTDTPRAEDINAMIYAVNRIIDAKTKQLEQRMEEENKKYWGAVVTIFALFVSLFSIINVGVKPALFSAELLLTPWALMYQSLLNIAPLTVVLLLFVWLLNRILGK